MRIQHNIAALNSHRQLGNNNNAVAKNLEKLSSGYRINRAGDDAAGLAISEKMRAQITGLKTAQKNANDGISLVQTAEGALTEVHSMLNRMVELADQSANGTYDNDVDRANLQKELDSLKSEIDRISDGTNFNGINLLDGSLGGARSGGDLTGSVIANYKGATTGAVTGTDASAAHVDAIKSVYEYDLGTTALTNGQTVTVGGMSITVDTSSADVVPTATDNGTIQSTDIDVQGAKIAEYLNLAGSIDTSASGSGYVWSYDSATNKLTATAKEAGAGGTAAGNIGGGTWNVTADQTATGAAEVGIDFFKKDTINVDGTEVKVDWSQLSAEDKSALQKNWGATTGVKADEAKKAATILQDTINSAIEKHNAENGTNLEKVKVTAGGTDDSAKNFTITSGQKDGNSKISFTGGANTVLGQMMGTGAVNSTQATPTLNFAPADVNGKFTLKLDDQTVEVDMSGAGLGATSTADDLINALNDALTTALTNYDTSKGLTGTPDALSGKLQAKINADGAIEFTNTTGKQIAFEDKDGGEVAKTLGISTEGKMSANGGLTLQIGDTAQDFNQLTVTVGSMSTNSLGLSGINIGTQVGAKNAVDLIKKAINTVSSTRGDLGAIQNRLEHTINNLSVTTENMTAAESRIRDVDMAEEMMNYTKNNILVQASQAMLAQANQLPQGVLQLLQ